MYTAFFRIRRLHWLSTSVVGHSDMQLFTIANDSDTCTVFPRLDAFSLCFGAAFIRGRRLNEEIRYTTGIVSPLPFANTIGRPSGDASDIVVEWLAIEGIRTRGDVGDADPSSFS